MTDVPELTHLKIDSAHSLRARFHIEPGHPVFQGHFPGQPVLPGVAQVHWAARTAQRYLPCRGTFSGLEALKFLRLIVPPTDITLELDWDSATGLLGFRYSRVRDERICSRGRFQFVL